MIIYGRNRNTTVNIMSSSLSITKSKQMGDTLVEVAIAISVLGVMLAASMAAINRNLMTIMNSAERTAIRSQIDSQAELLRYAWNNNIKLQGASAGGLSGMTLREALRNGYIGNGSEDTVKKRTCGVEQGNDRLGGGSFWLAVNNTGSNAKTAVKFIGSVDQFGWGGHGGSTTVASKVQNMPTTGGDNGRVAGIWIDAYKAAPSRWYVDFYIRACWTPYGSPTVGSGRMQTVVRFRYSGDKYEDSL